MYSQFESVDSVYNYLVDSTLQPTVATKTKAQIKPKPISSTSVVGQTDGPVQILPKGRVR